VGEQDRVEAPGLVAVRVVRPALPAARVARVPATFGCRTVQRGLGIPLDHRRTLRVVDRAEDQVRAAEGRRLILVLAVSAGLELEDLVSVAPVALAALAALDVPAVLVESEVLVVPVLGVPV